MYHPMEQPRVSRDEVDTAQVETLIFELDEGQKIWAERALHGLDMLEPLESGEFRLRGAPGSRLEFNVGLFYARGLETAHADRLLELFEQRCPRLFRLRDRFVAKRDLEQFMAELPEAQPALPSRAPGNSVYDSGLQRRILTVAGAFDGYLRSVEEGGSRTSAAQVRRVLDGFESYLVLRGIEDLFDDTALPGPFTLTVSCQVLLQAGPYFVRWCEQGGSDEGEDRLDLAEVRDVVEGLLVWLCDRRKIDSVELQEARRALGTA